MARLRLYLLPVVIGVVMTGYVAQAQGAAAQRTYDSLVTIIRGGDTTLDFTTLRMAYAAAPSFDPYDSHDSLNDILRSQLDSDRFTAALATVEQILAVDYCDIDAHALAVYCNDKLGRTAARDFHRAVRNGLLRSIFSSGHGDSPESAFVVIRVAEEYAVIRALGAESQKQSLSQKGGHSFDRLTVVTRSSPKKYELYFNIDIPLRRLEEQLKGK